MTTRARITGVQGRRLTMPYRPSGSSMPATISAISIQADAARMQPRRRAFAPRRSLSSARSVSSQITVSLRDEKNEEDSTIQDIREIVRRRGSRGIALATLGLEIRRRHRGFNVKLYGYSQLYRFIESIPDLEVIGDRADRKVVYRAKN